MAYIGFFPVDNGFTTARFRQQTQTKKTEAASGRIIRATNSTTRFRGTLQFPPMTLAEFKPVMAFVARCQGMLNEFDVIIPTISYTTGVAGQTITVTADASAGDTSVNIQSNSTSGTILKAGDVIRFYNHTKVYMVTEDVVADGSGNATINFQPNLVTAVATSDSSGEGVTSDSVPFRMIITNDLQEFAYRTDGLVEYELDVEEVI
jgi:hypothetical protein